MDDKAYEEKSNELEKELKPVLTNEFLSTLIKVVRTCGWAVDHTESIKLVRWCFDVIEKEYPKDLSPFIEEP